MNKKVLVTHCKNPVLMMGMSEYCRLGGKAEPVQYKHTGYIKPYDDYSLIDYIWNDLKGLRKKDIYNEIFVSFSIHKDNIEDVPIIEIINYRFNTMIEQIDIFRVMFPTIEFYECYDVISPDGKKRIRNIEDFEKNDDKEELEYVKKYRENLKERVTNALQKIRSRSD